MKYALHLLLQTWSSEPPQYYPWRLEASSRALMSDPLCTLMHSWGNRSQSLVCTLSDEKNHDYMCHQRFAVNYGDVIMGTMASQITSLTIVYSTVYSGADQTKYQSSASLTFMKGTHRWPVNSPHKKPVTRKMFPFDVVIMYYSFEKTFLWRTHKHLWIYWVQVK